MRCSWSAKRNENGREQNAACGRHGENGYQKIEDGVVKGYKAIENGAVSGYTAIQDGVVEGFTRISDAFVKKFLMRDGETLEEAKARIAREEEELHRQNQERVAASRQRNASN